MSRRIMPIDHRSDRPVYQQIADELRARIRGKTYPPGSKLPSEAELVEEFGVTRITVRRGLAVLQQEGLTETVRGKGVFVPRPPPVITLRNSRFSRAGKGALAAEAEAPRHPEGSTGYWRGTVMRSRGSGRS